MSRVRELRENPKNNLNLFNMLSVFHEKAKYGETLLRIFNKTPYLSEYASQVKAHFVKELEIPSSNFDKLSDVEIILLDSMTKTIFDLPKLKEFVKFCGYNERKLVKNNDLQKIMTFKEMIIENQNIEINLKDKNLEKERLIIYKEGDWISLIPLTYESSKKYGANTKWCTASEKTNAQFNSYGRNGSLIYNINTVTGEKVAVHKDLSDRSITFWNAKDHKVDSIETGLDIELIRFLKKYLKDPNLRPNSKLVSTKPGMKVKKSVTDEPMDMGSIVQQMGSISGATIRMQEQLDEDRNLTVLGFNDNDNINIVRIAHPLYGNDEVDDTEVEYDDDMGEALYDFGEDDRGIEMDDTVDVAEEDDAPRGLTRFDTEFIEFLVGTAMIDHQAPDQGPEDDGDMEGFGYEQIDI